MIARVHTLQQRLQRLEALPGIADPINVVVHVFTRPLSEVERLKTEARNRYKNGDVILVNFRADGMAYR